MDDERVVQFRREAAELKRRKGHASEYPAELRVVAVEYARERVAAGESARTIGQALGVSEMTVRCWLEGRSSGWRRVRVQEAPARQLVSPRPARAVVVMPSGVRIEGLGVDGVVAVLRALR